MTEEAVLEQVMGLFKRAGELDDEADELENEAKHKRGIVEEVLDEAETLWRPLVAAHPEWEGDLIMRQDPRPVEYDW